MPIKCALRSQVYGPFLLNMAIPFIVIALAGVAMVPKMLWEKYARRKRIREGTPVPRFKGKCNIPRACTPCSALRLPMTPNDVAGWRAANFSAQGRFAGVVVFAMFTHYPTLVSSIASIWNCTADIDGVRYLVADLSVVCYAPRHLWFASLACAGAVVYALGIPLAIAYATALKTPLVCRGPAAPERADAGGVGGERQGTASARLRMDVMRWTVPRCVCKRRPAAAYTSGKMRSRFAFLYNGYSTDRSGVVVAWESLVMFRKLTVTLAGSVISDPYLQILTAQLLLVVTALATAYAQPYETWWLNLLDIGGLFALILTQILSKLYFYAESAVRPFMDRDDLEVVVTTILFCLNLATAVGFFIAFGSEAVGLRTILEVRGKVRYKIAGKAQAQRQLVAAQLTGVDRSARIGGAERTQGRDSWADAVAAAATAADTTEVSAGAAASPSMLWRHPSGVAVEQAPMETTNESGDVVWLYSHPTVAASTVTPELLLAITDSVAIVAGDHYRWMHPSKRALSERHVEFADVGGWCSQPSGGDDQRSGGDNVAVGNGLELTAGGLEVGNAIDLERTGNDEGGAGTRGQVDVRNPMPTPSRKGQPVLLQRPMSGI